MNNFPTFKDFRGSFTPLNLSNHPYPVERWDQVNVSISDKKGTFRGMHYQSRIPQHKYIKVIQGSIIDYVYNLETKQVQSFYLSPTTASELFVPKQNAHGFLTLEDNTIVCYLTEGQYDPEFEHSIPYATIPEIKASIEQNLPPDTKEVIATEKDLKGTL